MNTPPDLAVAVFKGRVSISTNRLCALTLDWALDRPGASLRFLEGEEKPLSSLPSYEQVRIDLPQTEKLGISIWECAALTDRVLVVKRATRASVDAALHYISQNPYLDCRNLVIAENRNLRDDLDQAMRLGFTHLPVYSIENVRSTSIHCITNLKRKMMLRETLPTRQLRPISMLAPTFQGKDVAATASNHLGVLSTKGRPLLFSAPFHAYGFVANPQIASPIQGGIEVVGMAGLALHGPFTAVPPGQYLAAVTLRDRRFSGRGDFSVDDELDGSIIFDAYIAPDAGPLNEAVLSVKSVRGMAELAVDFEVPYREAPGMLELRIHQHSNMPFLVTEIELTWLN